MRTRTKGICYGIIYGMGVKLLSAQLQTSESEAVLFMDSFRDTYPGIKVFISETLQYCRDKGFVETLKGRRRYLPHINETDVTKKGIFIQFLFIAT